MKMSLSHRTRTLAHVPKHLDSDFEVYTLNLSHILSFTNVEAIIIVLFIIMKTLPNVKVEIVVQYFPTKYSINSHLIILI